MHTPNHTGVCTYKHRPLLKRHTFTDTCTDTHTGTRTLARIHTCVFYRYCFHIDKMDKKYLPCMAVRIKLSETGH